MAYLLKYTDEFGGTGYFDDFNDKLVEFNTTAEAEKKAEELLDMEYDDFGTAITKYYVVEVGAKALKEIKSFRITDDGTECALSCTDDSAKELENSLAEVKKQYDIDITEDRTYDNGSRIIRFTYQKKKKEEKSVVNNDYEVVVIHGKNVFTIGFDVKKCFVELNLLARVLMDKYRDEIISYNSERRNNAGTISFALVKKQEEFKEDLLKGIEVFFKAKVIEE